MSPEVILLVWCLGIGLLVSELFVPGIIMGSLGILGVLSAIVAAFVTQGPLWGGSLTLASVVIGGLVLVFGAKRLTLRNELTTEDGFVGTDDFSGLLGLSGVTATVLRPAGFATIGGKRIDVVTAGEMMDAGVPVEVVGVEGNRVEVRRKEA